MHPDITTTVIFTGDWSMPVKEAEATSSLGNAYLEIAVELESMDYLVVSATQSAVSSMGGGGLRS